MLTSVLKGSDFCILVWLFTSWVIKLHEHLHYESLCGIYLIFCHKFYKQVFAWDVHNVVSIQKKIVIIMSCKYGMRTTYSSDLSIITQSTFRRITTKPIFHMMFNVSSEQNTFLHSGQSNGLFFHELVL